MGSDASHLDQKTFSADCVGESASRGMCLWLGASLPWRSAIWGDVTVSRSPGPGQTSSAGKKIPGQGAAVNTRSVARLCIPRLIASMRAHIWMYMKHTNGKHTRGELNNGGTSITKTGWQRITRTITLTYHPDWMQQCFKMQKKKSQMQTEKQQSGAVTTCEVMQMIVRGTILSSTSGPPHLSGEP